MDQFQFAATFEAIWSKINSSNVLDGCDWEVGKGERYVLKRTERMVEE